MKRTTFLLLALTTALAALVYGNDLRRFLVIDTCLDGGGRWDYTRHVCDEG